TCVAFDWAKGPDSAGACSTSASGVVTCPGTNGLFDGGKFNGPTLNPSPPPFVGNDPDLPVGARDFGVDPLGIATNAAGVCANLSDLGSSSAKPCASNADCTLPGETCKSCGTGDPSVYTGVGSEKNGDTISGETYATATVPN